MAQIIVADENEGRRNLLANTLERAGYSVTRAGTLRQAEGTALATMPEVMLFDGDWKSGDPIDSSQRMMSDPEFAFKSRVIILSRNASQDYLIQAARAGVSEVIVKPVDMPKLLSQLEKHARKQFVPPPADVETSIGGGGSFDVSMVSGQSQWALPMLKGLVTPEKIDASFIEEIVSQLMEQGIELDENIDQNLLSNMLRLALNKLVDEVDRTPNEEAVNNKLPSKKGPTLSEGPKSMEDVLQNQADKLADEVEAKLDEILEEQPLPVTLLEEEEKMRIDPEVVEFTRLAVGEVYQLMWDIARPNTLNDLTLMTRVEDATQMLKDIIDHLPSSPKEEE